MISADAKLSIQHIPLQCIQIKEVQVRYPARLQHYIGLYTQYPGHYAGLLSVTPSDTHPGLYALLDGHHRLCAAIMCGRKDVLCVVIEEEETDAQTQTTA